ncbi:IclR family transcriptional regulator [Paenibacillus periandrae]|uniref:IclR family transcriptional regulator n=1 Tax=Paenibacillus periandrae TaxID=1761741 RepID=UPI001F099E3F|nr:IclR family transcriptional regulator [Paenibacillus periandrae]
MTDKPENDYLLSSVKNALRILNSFSQETHEKRVSDLAVELGVGKSTISRLLSTLASEGYVIKDPNNQKYRLGLRILTLNSIVTSQLEINREARPILKELVRDTGEAAHIAVLEDEDVVYIEQIECLHPVRILSYVGRRNPIHCTSSGKVLLAFQETSKIERLLATDLVRYTMKTIIDPSILKTQLAEIRESEVCYSECEFLEDVVSFAAPIRNYSKKVIASISLVGPKHRIKQNQLPALKNKVIKAAKEISKNLGYSGH